LNNKTISKKSFNLVDCHFIHWTGLNGLVFAKFTFDEFFWFGNLFILLKKKYD